MMFSYLVFIGLLSIFTPRISSEAAYKVEDGVIVLSQTNFKEVLAEHEYVLVEFYAPWCGHCKQLAPEYAKAAQLLESQESNIKLAKVDATEESKLAEEYNVRGYPTLKFFLKGVPIDYTGGRSANDIVSWVSKKTGPPAAELTTVEELTLFTENNTVAIVGFFKDQSSDSAKKYLAVASTVDDLPFAIVTSDAVAASQSIEGDKIILFKKFDERKVEFEGDIEEAKLKSFVLTQSLPSVVEFNTETATKIFGGEIKSHVLFFFSKKDGHFDKHLEAARKVAQGFKEKVLFVTINTDEDDHVRIVEYFGIKKEEIPVIRAIKLEEDMVKFKPESSDLGEETLRAFVSDFVEGKLKQHYLSQVLPEDWNSQPVKVLVASNFKEIALDENKDVLVEFYAPWCGHCKQLVPIYDQLGEKYENKEDIVIAKIDATLNELEDVKISSFPTITLYPKDKSKVVEYSGERTLEGLSKFIDSKGEYGKSATPSSAEEEDADDEEPQTVPKDEL